MIIRLVRTFLYERCSWLEPDGQRSQVGFIKDRRIVIKYGG